MGLKTVASLGKEKYERIGATKAKEILKGIDYTTRGKLKTEAKNLGTGKVSVISFIRGIGKKQGRVAASKVIGATQKYFNDDVDPGIQKRYLKANMQRDESGLIKPGREMPFAGGSLASKTIGAARTKGSMGDIGVKRGAAGFAQNLNNTKLPGSSAPQAPAGGTRPIGL